MIGVALTTRGLVKKYGSRRALDEFSLSVPRGAVMGMVGPNGAGKTTWMSTVAGLLRPSAGTVDLLGAGPFNAAVHSGRISILPQDSELPPEQSSRTLLYRYARMQGLGASAARKSVDDTLAKVHLGDRADDPVRSLSHGMRKRVMLAQCFIGTPELVLLDEPLNGLDPAERAHERNFIASQRGRCTVVVSSHDLHDLQLVCTHVAFVEKGKVVRCATMDELTKSVHRIVYRLGSAPGDLAALNAALPGAAFNWNPEKLELECSYSDGDAASINRTLLPLLLSGSDVLEVSAGATLEQSYLKA